MKLSDKGAALLEEFEGFRSWLGCSAPREALRQLAREDPLMPTLVGTALHETCGAWRGAGPCGRPAVERLHYANECGPSRATRAHALRRAPERVRGRAPAGATTQELGGEHAHPHREAGRTAHR